MKIGRPKNEYNSRFRKVDLADMNIFSRKFMIEEHLLKEDMDRNGVVDMDDVILMTENWLWKK